jgi:hypothetical protein
MKEFSSVDMTPKEVEAPDPYAPIKVRMVQGLNRSEEIRKLVEDWIVSFRGGITKAAYDQQMKRLDYDDAIAATQLAIAKGRRTIPLPPPPKKPALPNDLLQQMLIDKYVAVYGRKFKPAIRDVIKQLKECGTVCVFEVEKFIMEFKSFDDKGKGPYMMDSAVDADFLVIVDLEMPIHLEWHIREAIERIGRRREELGKPIISTWCRFNDCNAFFERFKIYEVK